MQRRLRVWRLLPPRKCLGAHSRQRTLLPARRAVIAAHSAALPPPNIKTSYTRETTIGFSIRDWQDRDRICRDRGERDRSSHPGLARIFGGGRYFLSLFSDQLCNAASVFSTCLVGFRLIE